MSVLATGWGALILGQVSGARDVAATSPQVQSVWDFVLKGGPMMVPIIGCSLVAVAVFVERVISLRRSIVIPPGFLPGLRALMNDDDPDHTKAVEYCASDGSPIARVIRAGLKTLGRKLEIVEKHVQEAGEREVVKLRKYMRILTVIAAIAPLMGLLGTILGLINAFQTVAVSADALGKTELLAAGIYEAMITTAAGLLLAIPVLIAYHWIASRIDALIVVMDQLSMEFIEEYAAPRGTAAVLVERSQPSGNGRTDGTAATDPDADADTAAPDRSDSVPVIEEAEAPAS